MGAPAPKFAAAPAHGHGIGECQLGPGMCHRLPLLAAHCLLLRDVRCPCMLWLTRCYLPA